MATKTKTRSAEIRERLNHPIVDGDGHFVEIFPLFDEYLREVGGPKLLERFQKSLPFALQNYDGPQERVGGPQGWQGLSWAERMERRVTRGGFWSFPTGLAIDRATVMLPNLFRARMDDLGIDYAILYGSSALLVLRNADEEIRRAVCRAFNLMCVDLYGPHSDRMTCAAAIPMHTPSEAIEELEFAVKKLGMKVAVFGTNIRRTIPYVAKHHPEMAPYATWWDVVGISSQYDYDPVWRKCVELNIAVTAHTNNVGCGTRSSPENYMYNQIGHFAAGNDAFCKALVLGGVTERFPTLRFGFLEGGVGWASILYNDLIEHWEKRNVKAMYEHLDPGKLDVDEMNAYFEKYGGEKIGSKRIDALKNEAGILDAEELDDWRHLHVENPRRFAEYFRNFFFGCEADDRMTALAFDTKLNHYGERLQAMFSTDIGHWDVPDMTKVVAEAYELVERGLLSEADFRDFTFANPVKLHASMNPSFFEGTAVAEAARNLLGETT